MEELSSKNPVIEKFQEYEEFFRAHSGVIREYVFNRRFMQDLEETRRIERERADARGERRGRKANALENARNLRKQGILSDEQIAEALNLPLKTVTALQEVH